MLGIMESLREFQLWLVGSETPVSVILDHKNLEYFMTLQHLNHRQARWSLELAEYNFKLLYAPGKKTQWTPLLNAWISCLWMETSQKRSTSRPYCHLTILRGFLNQDQCFPLLPLPFQPMLCHPTLPSPWMTGKKHYQEMKLGKRQYIVGGI